MCVRLGSLDEIANGEGNDEGRCAGRPKWLQCVLCFLCGPSVSGLQSVGGGGKFGEKQDTLTLSV